MPSRWRAIWSAFLFCACAGETEAELLLELQTDLVPGIEFVGVEIELLTEQDGDVVGARRHYLSTDAALPGRVAEFSGLQPGSQFVRVRLREPLGDIRLERIAVVDIPAGSTVASIVMTRSCEGIECPNAGGDPLAIACLGGRCVRAECTPETPEFCPPPDCTTAAECPAAADCAQARCDFGVCVPVVLPLGCGPDAYCQPEVGCLPRTCGGGPLGNGQACLENADCGNTCIGNVCTDPSGLTGTCDVADAEDCTSALLCPTGTCQLPDGASCSSNDECVGVCNGSVCVPSDQPNGAVCDENSDCQNTCIANTCADSSGAQGSCDISDSADCVSGHQCPAGSCLGEVGTPCSADIQCLDICNGTLCATSNQANGNPCDENSDCLNTCIALTCADFASNSSPCDNADNADCTSGNLCPTGTCLGDLGTPCANDTQCLDICNGSTCVNPNQANGNPCDENSDCLNTCIGLLCSNPSGNGGICDLADSTDCTSGLLCPATSCLGGPGAPCSSDSECVEICNGSICVAANQPNGAACDEDSDCLNVCTGGICSDWALTDHFVTTWTVGPGDTEQSVTIAVGSGVFNYDVDWNNDGVFDDIGVTSNITQAFAPGTHTVRIRGQLPHFLTQPQQATNITAVNQENADKLQSIDQWGAITWDSMRYSFAFASNLTLVAVDIPNTSAVTSMERTFYRASSFDGAIGTWDTSNIVSMTSMFHGASSFNQNINSWDVTNVTNMASVFRDASSFNQDISGWDVLGVSNMSTMFQGAASFNQDISGWDMSETRFVSGMFRDAIAFNQPIGTWDTTSVSNMTSMFRGATAFNQPIGTWDTSGITNMSEVFEAADAFNQDISGWNTSSVTQMRSMFQGADTFDQDISGWNTSSVTRFDDMFAGARDFNQDIGGWDTSSLVRLDGMFSQAFSFDQDISGWDTSRVTDMSGVFNQCTAFNQDISSWDTSNVTDMSRMFGFASSFNQPVATWDTSNVRDMSNMFFRTAAFNQPVGIWDTSNVTSMSSMFYDATAFNQPIGAWDTSGVTDMTDMFRNAAVFNQPIGAWDTSGVTDMRTMFFDAAAFDQDISGWDTSSVTNMRTMFTNATSFDRSLGTWNVSNVTDMTTMFDASSLSGVNYDATLSGWATLPTLQPGVTFGVTGLVYCTSTSDRSAIISTYSWSFVGDSSC